jgi:hypothetical protein
MRADNPSLADAIRYMGQDSMRTFRLSSEQPS